jgi:hypothetical protein
LIGFAVAFFFDTGFDVYLLSGGKRCFVVSRLGLLRSFLNVLLACSDLNFLLSGCRGWSVSSFLLLVNANLLFSTVVLDLRDGSGEGCELGFVTFPSDARSLIR